MTVVFFATHGRRNGTSSRSIVRIIHELALRLGCMPRVADLFAPGVVLAPRTRLGKPTEIAFHPQELTHA